MRRGQKRTSKVVCAQRKDEERIDDKIKVTTQDVAAQRQAMKKAGATSFPAQPAGAVMGAIYRWDTATGKVLTPEAGDSVAWGKG
jgi:hypothetical protein